MPINFPDNPTEGTQHTVGGITWQYDYSNAVWNVVTGGSAFRVSATAPSSPVTGDLWYDTESGEMFIYYDSAWVSPSVVATVAASVKVSATAPTAPAIGDLWFDSNTGDLTIYYDSQWVSPSVAASLATASASTITGTNSEGTSTSFARADHNHQIQAIGAFDVRLSGGQYFNSGAAAAQVAFTNKVIDVNNWYSTSTYRYTPQQAGYYLLGAWIKTETGTSGGDHGYIILRKNTSEIRHLFLFQQAGYPNYPRGGGTAIVEANGTTDYFQIFYYQQNANGWSRALYGADNSPVDGCRFYGHFLGSA